MEDNEQYVSDRIAFCEHQAKSALCRGEDDEAAKWQEIIARWQRLVEMRQMAMATQPDEVNPYLLTGDELDRTQARRIAGNA